MKIFFYLVLVVLVFLAVSSGVTKILLMPQDVDFFGEFGFTNPILIGYGATQLLGGLLLAIPKSRIWGAILVALTFLISAIVLVVAGDFPLAAVTLLCIVLLCFVISQSRASSSVTSDAINT